MLSFTKLAAIFFLTVMIAVQAVWFIEPTQADQIGITFQEESIGGLADYETMIAKWKLAADAQAQKTDMFSYTANASVEHTFGVIGLKPFVSADKGDKAMMLDAGAVINAHYKGLDIAAGASWRGADPVAQTDYNYDADGNRDPDAPGLNTFSYPDENNINAIFRTGFEKYDIETGVALYYPITKRDIVPVIVISRSQTSIDVTEDISLSGILDVRVFGNFEHIDWKPIGSITYKF